MLSPLIFRAYDIRGEYRKDLDEEGMKRIGMALGSYMCAKKLKTALVGGDTRPSTPSLKKAVMDGLTSTGINVFDCPQNTFGVTAFTARSERLDCSFYVTASHLPPQHNGLKPFYGSGLSFMPDEIKIFGQLALQKKFVQRGRGRVRKTEKTDEYIKFAKERFDCSRVKVALDCGGATATLVMPRLFEELGMQTRKVFCEPDPTLSVRSLQPAKETLGELVKTVKQGGVDFGVAFDGDADRAVIVDETGEVLFPDQVATILGKHLLKNGEGVIVATVECSTLPDKVLAPLGATIVRVPVGHSFIIQAGYEHKALLGYEASGHMVMPSISLSDDALFTVLSLAQMLKHTGAKLSKLAAELPKIYRKRVMFQTTETEKFGIVAEVREKLLDKYDRVTTMDGIRVDTKTGWALIRVSNTAPVIRLTVEADSPENLEKLKQEFSEDLKARCHSSYEMSF